MMWEIAGGIFFGGLGLFALLAGVAVIEYRIHNKCWPPNFLVSR